MNLLETFDGLIGSWRDVFPQTRTFQRARRLVFGLLVSVRMHLTSNAICATGRQFVDWTADYRVCSRSPWNPHRLFDPIFDHLPQLLASPGAPVRMALDDTMCKKSSARIPGVSMGRDPMSPPFHVNLCYGLRFVQASILVTSTQADGPARALPVRFDFAPPAKKPKQNKPKKSADAISAQPQRPVPGGAASDSPPSTEPPQTSPAADPEGEKQKQEWDAKWQAYKKEHKLRRLPLAGLNAIRSVRESLNQRPETCQRTLIVSGDGSYTTRDVVRNLPALTTYIGRIRKDAKLHYPLEAPAGKSAGRPRRYGAEAPTPEQILRDDSIPVMEVRCFAAGKFHDIPVKVLRGVYWRKAGVDVPIQVIVIKPLAYRLRKGSKLLYRKPAFLICTDSNMDLQALVQDYVYRWEIECNHRDEKSLLGVAQGQVWNRHAVQRLPQLQVASYSLLLLASLLSSGFQRTADYLPLPKWRRQSARPSLLDLLNLLRNQIFARGVDAPVVSFDDFASAAVPPELKSSKLPLAAETLTTVAA
jgi:hypothetical protein